MPFFSGLHFESLGSGQPIIFLHGLGLNAESMRGFFEPSLEKATTPSYQRVYVDLPGMGESIMPPELTTSDQVLAMIHKFITPIAGGRKAILVGHSYGGYLALGLIAKHPQNFVGAFLTAPVVIAEKSKRTVAAQKHLILEPIRPETPAFQDFLKMNVKVSTQTWADYQRLILPGIKQFNLAAWNQIKASGHYAFSFEPQLPKLLDQSLPVHMILGQNDTEVGYGDQLGFSAQMPTIINRIVPNAGHNVFIDAPDDTRQAFLDFLSNVSERK
ncbi:MULTISPECIES: alpha/beta fold hydrolase [Lactobacillaceae]|uniref:alpha/beta fold hydrolase n=1 Tax=Lactobacillaceae TaxID=33958 RepID=UPI00078B2B0B|nr:MULTISPECIES: alpha/beta hydrolase [Lactobacillaceae]AMV70371.1 hydrolase, alpha/beta fold family [Pediococcus damnosus]MCB5223354.1 alpha/beta hydrolase [Lactiplantibacillus pentosus]